MVGLDGAVRLLHIDEFGELVGRECEQWHNDKNNPLLDDTSNTCVISLPITTSIT